jgi:acyl carrier protein
MHKQIKLIHNPQSNIQPEPLVQEEVRDKIISSKPPEIEIQKNQQSEKEICEKLQHMLADLMGFIPPKQPDIHEGFFDMGMESVTAVAIQKEIDERFGVSIDDTATFDYPNLSDLAAYVFTLLSENSMIDNESEIDVNSLIEKIPDEIENLSIDDVVERLTDVMEN